MNKLMLACLWALLRPAAAPASVAGPEPPPAPAPRILNNCVSELLAVSTPSRGTATSWRFANPRPGWVFLRSVARIKTGGRVLVAVSTVSGPEARLTGTDLTPTGAVWLAHESVGRDTREAMRLLPAGEYTLSARCQGRAVLRELVVRAIPELVYCKFQYDPLVPPHGPYDWPFLRRHVLTNINCIVGSGVPEHRDFLASWKTQGKRWLVECGVPGLEADQPVTADQAFAYWTQNVGFSEVQLDGVIADEFLPDRRGRKYSPWTDALRRIRAEERFRHKVFYPYCTSLYNDSAGAQFIQAVVAAGYPLAWERYFPEPATEAEARQVLATKLTGEMQRWQQAIPGCISNLIVCFGYMSLPTTETLNLNPQVDFKVWMDLQFQHVATAPAFRGLYGLMEYTSGYADDETVRWTARLYRHYGLEGNTTPLSSRLGFTYQLDHLRNPDFADGTAGWTLMPAGPGRVASQRLTGYGWLQGRYPRTQRGDTFLWTQRSAAKPNLVSQPIRHLLPGRLYSLKCVTADFQELKRGKSAAQRHAVSIRIRGARLIQEKCFQQPMANNYAHTLGPFKGQNNAWMNYHYRVFRAQHHTAELTLSDWLDPSRPGGPANQELIWNFVEVQPYWGEVTGH